MDFNEVLEGLDFDTPTEYDDILAELDEARESMLVRVRRIKPKEQSA
jgi:hypothetical protein